MRVRGDDMVTIEPTNPYAPPRAALDLESRVGMAANLEAAVEGRYDFTVGEVMDEAWRLVKGMKASFWGAAVIVVLIDLLFDTICSVVFGFFLTKEPNAIVKQIFRSAVAALMTPVTMGMTMMCVRRALGAPISFGTAFSYYAKSLPALGCALLVFLLTWAGVAALLLPGLYLWIAYTFAIQLVCDQGLSPWQAMETSRRAVKYKWWELLGIQLLVGLLTAVSALGLLIPLIWTIPWAMMTLAVLYRRIFYAPPSPAPVAAAPAAPNVAAP
jgi:hypothetical protein